MTIHGNFIFYEWIRSKALLGLASMGVSVASAVPVGTDNMSDRGAALGQILAAFLTFATTWWRRFRYQLNPRLTG
jgi:hypothetical protein